jgi:hypothetical protein
MISLHPLPQYLIRHPALENYHLYTCWGGKEIRSGNLGVNNFSMLLTGFREQ